MSDLLEVEDVAWFLVESEDGYTFTTTGRTANVELTVPAEVDRSEATAPLVDLAPAIKAEDPVELAQAGGTGERGADQPVHQLGVVQSAGLPHQREHR